MNRIEGLPELSLNIQRLIKAIDEDAAQNAIRRCGNVLKRGIAARAAQGPTGNLKRGYRSKKFKRATKGQPAAFVAVDYRIAPHAHLYEFGTKERRPKTKKVMKSKAGKFYGKKTGPMPKNPVFQTELATFAPKYPRLIAAQMKKLIQDWVKPGHRNAVSELENITE